MAKVINFITKKTGSMNLLENMENFIKTDLIKDWLKLLQSDVDSSESRESQEKLDPTEVAEVAYEDFLNKIFALQTPEQQQKYSPQLRGSMNMLGEPLLYNIFKSRYKGGILGTLKEKVQIKLVQKSLQISRVPESEIQNFFDDLELYLKELENIKTLADLETMREKNQFLTIENTSITDNQLEEQMNIQVEKDKEEYIFAQKAENPDWDESKLKVSERIGYLPLKMTDIKSLPFERSDTGTTLCSKTAFLNAQKFGINVPRGNAKDAVESPPISSKFISTNKDREKLKDPAYYSQFAPDANFVDLSIQSNTAAGKIYGHRAVAFLNQMDHQWYILDPYMGERAGIKKPTPESPVLLSEYQKRIPILQANFYQSDYYVA